MAHTDKPCFNPYCECVEGKCTHPGFYDSRGKFNINDPRDVKALHDDLKFILAKRGIKDMYSLDIYNINVIYQ